MPADEVLKFGIPGVNPFDALLRFGITPLLKRLPQTGILVAADYLKGRDSAFRIFTYNGIRGVGLPERAKRNGGGTHAAVSIDFEGGRELTACYEPPDYPDTGKVPNVRTYHMFMPSDWDGVDTHTLSNGGRLLISNATSPINGYPEFRQGFNSFNPRNIKGLARVFQAEDYAGATEAVNKIASKLIGVNPTDAEFISSQVKAKLAA